MINAPRFLIPVPRSLIVNPIPGLLRRREDRRIALHLGAPAL